MAQKHDPHHHERKHVHIHAQHYEQDKGGGRIWLVGGIGLLIVALVYSAVLVIHAQQRSSSGTNLDLVQMQFDPSRDELGVAYGPADATVTVREFADYQCPACGGFEPVMQQMRKDYVDTGKVRFIFFDFPLEDIHKNSVAASQFARCAGDQGKYWQTHDMLYGKQAEWGNLKDPMNTLLGYGDKLGLDGNRLLTCIRTGAMHEAVMSSEAYADALSMRATPTFAVNDEAYVGGIPYSQLKTLIDGQLAATAKH
jgi:protein-disulfide isomerase